MTQVDAHKSFPEPLLEIAAFVDSTTVVLTGSGLSVLVEGDELYILGIGDTVIPKINVPLIVPKGSLEVTAQAGLYVIARSPNEQIIVPNALAGALANTMFDATQTVLRRSALSRDDVQFLGNPGRGAIRVGDTVIRKSDLRIYIDWRAHQRLSA